MIETEQEFKSDSFTSIYRFGFSWTADTDYAGIRGLKQMIPTDFGDPVQGRKLCF